MIFEKDGVDGHGHGLTYRTLTPRENFCYITLAYPPLEEDQTEPVDEIYIDGV
jgi:hypothetical protein